MSAVAPERMVVVAASPERARAIRAELAAVGIDVPAYRLKSTELSLRGVSFDVAFVDRGVLDNSAVHDSLLIASSANWGRIVEVGR